jgi:hypothetical protein
MALALNVFRTVTAEFTTVTTTVYTAPVSYTGIVLLAQIANVTGTAGTVTVSVTDSSSAVTELLKDFEIPANDAASAISGKLVIQTGCELKISASANSKFKLTLSILESANE